MDEITRMMTRNNGICRFSHLQALGLNRFQIRGLVNAELIYKTARGTYSLPGADPVLVRAAGINLSVTCVTAASYHGLWVLRRPAEIHATADRAKRIPGVVLHRGRRSARQLVLPVIESVSHALRCLPELDALVIAESAVVNRRLEISELLSRFDGERDWRIRKTIGLIEPRSESPMETLARHLMLTAGLEIEVQKVMSGVGRVDFLVEGVLVVEIDGYDFHSSTAQFDNDRRRLNQLSVQGIPLLRFSGRQLLHDPEEFLFQIHAALRRLRRSFRPF